MTEKNETLEVLTQLVDLLKESNSGGMHTKTPATSHTAVRLHGSGGLFAGPGLERDVISAHIRNLPGLAGRLPLLPSVTEDPRFASLTGFTDVSGAEPTTACQDAPSGYMKGCNLSARFGLIRRDTQTIEMDKVMLKLHRGDFTDLVLRGQVLGMTDFAPSGLDQGSILDVITMSEMVNVGVQVERLMAKQFWQGTYGVGTEFPGLDVQIATGQKDADTGTLCPALDSDVKDYNCTAIGASIVEYLSYLEFYLRSNATRMGLDPVTWVIVMRPELWFELSAYWPCAYNTNKCATSVAANSTVYVDGRQNVQERDAMRNGLYLDVNGNRYDVVLDTGIHEDTNTTKACLPAGSYSSSIYMVPLRITGNFPVLYREYVDYREALPDINLLRGNEQFFWTDNGVYSWFVEQIKWCYKLGVKTEQRVILRTPQLAGRIDNIRYDPLQHIREADPDSPYWVDGGVSLRAGMVNPYAVWTSRQ